ncbi:DUF6299 family protein [Nocardia arthritidis]|nr:DUF6299 family protein [Nocardia arthritidis]
MAEYLRTAEQRATMPKNRFMNLAVASASALAGTIMLAGPATADPTLTLTVDSNQHLNADGTEKITGTYTCTAVGRVNSTRNSYLRQGEVQPIVPASKAMVTCDGAAHPYTTDIPAPETYPFQPGPATFNITWDLYSADGSTEVRLTDLPVTLQ